MSNLKCKSKIQNWNKNKAKTTKISGRIFTKLCELLSLSLSAVSACLKMISIVSSCCSSLCFLVVTSFLHLLYSTGSTIHELTSLATQLCPSLAWPGWGLYSVRGEFALLRNSVSKVKQMKVVRTNKLKCLSLTCRRSRDVFIVTYVCSGYIINIH